MRHLHATRGLLWVGAIVAVGCGLSQRDPPTTTGPPLHGSGASVATGTVVVGVGAGLVAGGGGGDCLPDEVICNGFDDDCDSSTTDQPLVDADMDGYLVCDDCDDNRPSSHPGAFELCGDGVDQDCDGLDVVCAVCGNDVLEPPEVCDDGNQASGDGCRFDCKGTEVCGDGLADLQTEECDPPQDGACIGACVGCACPAVPGPWRFVDVTVAAGLTHQHAYDTAVDPPTMSVHSVSGGLAAGDYDGDGYVDLYAVGGHLGTNTLWRNTGSGAFVDMAGVAGVALTGLHGSGPVFADVDGDGGLDLLVGSLLPADMRYFRNRLNGTFEDLTASVGLVADAVNIGAAFGDYDRDGDLDLALAHWGTPSVDSPKHLWQNDGSGTFTSVGATTGVDDAVASGGPDVWTFTPSFTDYDDDGWPDLLWANDFSDSRVLHNDGGTFSNVTTAVISDDNGMGSAIGDYDGDGDLDWFVSAIWHPNAPPGAGWGLTGNRLYQNQGDGTFTDVTSAAGVRAGHWGWGACMADFDNDGHLDIFHTAGYQVDGFDEYYVLDPTSLFLSNGDGTFTERALELGLVHLGQGRGVVCFDYDQDGDVDVAIFENAGSLRLFENRLTATRHYLTVELEGKSPNTEAAGARVTLTVGAATQVREIRVGSNYVSQDPALAHFGLGTATLVEALTVRWPDQTTTILTDVAVDQRLTILQP